MLNHKILRWIIALVAVLLVGGIAIRSGYLATLPAFLTWFPLAIAFLVAFAAIYSRLTPWRELDLIRAGNIAAALSFGGALIGYAVVVGVIMTNSHSRGDLIVWCALGMAVQCAVPAVARLILGASLKSSMEEGRVAIGVFMASMAISAGIINAATMVP